MNHKIVLASTSPYRKALMEQTGFAFETAKPLCDEESLKKSFQGELSKLCMHLAQNKAESLRPHFPSAVIIGSDQALMFEQEVLGKGHNFEGAFKQLKKVSGKTALLITATYISSPSGNDHFFECNTELNFKPLSDKEIKEYLELDEPYDCAGSFKFEKNGRRLFSSVVTDDETAIQGLPLGQLTNWLTLVQLNR